MNKEQELLKFSNPKLVQEKALDILGPSAIIYYSIRKNKKYMILNPINKKWVHFGEMGFSDYTKHNDPKRLMDFKIRNEQWGQYEPYTPAFLSYYLLW
jgi:hypothetical protein